MNAWMSKDVTTGHHISCTNKMGPEEDNMAVVDQSGRIHGADGIRVVDASIMPECVRANINVTVMTMAERIAYRVYGVINKDAFLKCNRLPSDRKTKIQKCYSSGVETWNKTT